MSQDAPTAVSVLGAALVHWSAHVPPPLVVAVDGHGASGKTTLVAALEDILPIAVIHGDDFFVGVGAGDGPSGDRVATRENGRASDGPPHVNDYYDFDRLRAEALEPLIENRPTEFEAHDRSRQRENDHKHTVELEPSELIVVEGVGSAGAPLADLVQRRILVATPQAVRLKRLHELIAPADWDQRWLAAEFAYFEVDPPEFDLVVTCHDPATQKSPSPAAPESTDTNGAGH